MSSEHFINAVDGVFDRRRDDAFSNENTILAIHICKKAKSSQLYCA